MELAQLRYFREVVREGSISRAADSLHITQSALSKSISKMEDELEVRLFEREGNRIHLNRFGEILLQYAERTLLSLERGTKQIRAVAGLEQGSVHFGFSPDVYIKHLVRDFLIQHPDVEMVSLLQSDQQMVALLENGSVDFTLSTNPVPGNEIEWIPLYEDRLCVIVPSTHFLAGSDGAFLRDFQNERFICTNLGYGMINSTKTLCRAAGFEPRILYEGADMEIAPRLIAEGVAVEILPMSVSEGSIRFYDLPPSKGLASVPLKDEFSRKTIGLNVHAQHYRSEAVSEFMGMITRYFATL